MMNSIFSLSISPLRSILTSLSICFCLLATTHAYAYFPMIDQTAHMSYPVLAQNAEIDENYDPFADYSEFEQSMEEEEDVHFFRNGRLMSFGLVAGYRGWTSNLAAIYSGDPAFGMTISYFFDLRFALEFGFISSNHILVVKGINEVLQGNVGLFDLHLNFRYYLNTQNVTRGLASLNPYLFAGFGELLRTLTLDVAADEGPAKDGAFEFNAGGGIEVPLLRNKLFLGIQGAYHLVEFPDENQYLRESDGSTRIVKPAGDSYTVMGILGTNF